MPEQPQQDADEVRTTPASGESDTRTISKIMVIGIWVILLGLLTWFAHRWYERAENPNQTVNIGGSGAQQYVELQANRSGHYVANGLINGFPVVFLLDTGATNVSVPQTIADKIGLIAGRPLTVRTANGSATVYASSLSSVTLGVFERKQVTGHINPNMRGGFVLLGMSFLKHFDLSARDEVLTISLPN